MIAVNGPEFVAVKISPGWTFHNVYDTDPIATFTYVTKELSKRRIAYLQVGNYGMDWDVYGTLRPLFDGPFMVVAGFTRASAAAMVSAGGADLVAFGQVYISNPDLAERYRNGWPSIASTTTRSTSRARRGIRTILSIAIRRIRRRCCPAIPRRCRLWKQGMSDRIH